MAIPRHILTLRQISSRIAKQIYSSSCTNERDPEESDAIIRAFHKELIDWRRNMPFPIPHVNARVPHMSSSWYDFNFYTHLALLYRPSPLCPVITSNRMEVLADAAAMAIRQAVGMHQQQRFAFNWLNLLSLFTATMSLIYTSRVSTKDSDEARKLVEGIVDLESAVDLLDIFSLKFPSARKIRQIAKQAISYSKEKSY